MVQLCQRGREVKEGFPAKATAMAAAQTGGANQSETKRAWVWLWDKKWHRGPLGVREPGLECVQAAALLWLNQKALETLKACVRATADLY